MSKKGISYIIDAELTGPLVNYWVTALKTATRQSLARWAVDQIDFNTGLLQDSWECLDEPMCRALAIKSDPNFATVVAEIIVPDKRGGLHIPLEDAAERSGMHKKQTKTKLRSSIMNLVPDWLQRPEIAKLISADTFGDGWKFLANEIGKRTYKRYAEWQAGGQLEEWHLLNHLLLAEYFRQCRYNKAMHVMEELKETRSGIMSVRGMLVNTSRFVSPSAIAETNIPISNFSGGAVLHHRSVSDLVDYVHVESASTAAKNGVLQRILGKYTQIVPERVQSGEVGKANWLQNRKLRYAQFESTILAYMSVAAIEQLIRGLAQQKGYNTIKSNGAPDGIPSVFRTYDNLSLPDKLINNINTIFDSGKSNIRNRMMHGSFMLTNSKRLQVNMIAAGRVQPDDPLNQDPHNPENIAKLALETLEYLDSEIRKNTPLSQTDLDWGSRSRLSTNEIHFCQTLCQDMIPTEDSLLEQAKKIQQELSAYFRVVLPGLGQYFRLGYLSLSQSFSKNTVPLLHALAIIFESTYRLTCHLLRMEILDKPKLKSSPKGRPVCIQYYMLDENGMCRSEYYDRLVEHCDAANSSHAKRTLKCAVTVRNALSHGAIVTFDEPTADATTRAMIEAIRILVAAGRHHMISDSAWYQWKDIRDFKHGFAQIDWEESECTINDWLAKEGQPPKV